jgi:hypothetical protein
MEFATPLSLTPEMLSNTDYTGEERGTRGTQKKKTNEVDNKQTVAEERTGQGINEK